MMIWRSVFWSRRSLMKLEFGKIARLGFKFSTSKNISLKKLLDNNIFILRVNSGALDTSRGNQILAQQLKLNDEWELKAFRLFLGEKVALSKEKMKIEQCENDPWTWNNPEPCDDWRRTTCIVDLEIGISYYSTEPGAHLSLFFCQCSKNRIIQSLHYSCVELTACPPWSRKVNQSPIFSASHLKGVPTIVISSVTELLTRSGYRWVKSASAAVTLNKTAVKMMKNGRSFFG